MGNRCNFADITKNRSIYVFFAVLYQLKYTSAFCKTRSEGTSAGQGHQPPPRLPKSIILMALAIHKAGNRLKPPFVVLLNAYNGAFLY